MRTALLPFALLALTAQAPAPAPPKALPPGEIVAAAPQGDWVDIAASDLLVMDLASGKRVVIQLMPPPFSQGWVGNIRKLAAARFWDGTSINRVQDNYVVQWGDPNGEDKARAKVLPPGLAKMREREYAAAFKPGMFTHRYTTWGKQTAIVSRGPMVVASGDSLPTGKPTSYSDAYVTNVGFASGFAIGMDYTFKLGDTGSDRPDVVWPVHCYGMVGVGRDMPPDTGTGAELYTVIGHAPRHLDRNIALVGRVISGVEHLSSLPRGTGALGFYEKAGERTAITSVRLGNEVTGLPRYQYLSTESETFARYADARANRRDAFFIQTAGGADICNIPVPVRMAK